MRSAWVECCRYSAVAGTSRQLVRDEFVTEFLETTKRAVWMDEAFGTFMVFDKTYRVFLHRGPDREQWIVTELKVTGSKTK